jgi:hypothetical protein
LLEHPVPVTENRPLLAWQPIFADMASSGRHGLHLWTLGIQKKH